MGETLFAGLCNRILVGRRRLSFKACLALFSPAFLCNGSGNDWGKRTGYQHGCWYRTSRKNVQILGPHVMAYVLRVRELTCQTMVCVKCQLLFLLRVCCFSCLLSACQFAINTTSWSPREKANFARRCHVITQSDKATCFTIRSLSLPRCSGVNVTGWLQTRKTTGRALVGL